MNFMIPIYVALIQKGRKTIDEVPENLRNAVQKALDAAKTE